jgi:hypothetical protein
MTLFTNRHSIATTKYLTKQTLVSKTMVTHNSSMISIDKSLKMMFILIKYFFHIPHERIH